MKQTMMIRCRDIKPSKAVSSDDYKETQQKSDLKSSSQHCRQGKLTCLVRRPEHYVRSTTPSTKVGVNRGQQQLQTHFMSHLRTLSRIIKDSHWSKSVPAICTYVWQLVEIPVL